jgi:CheY-like chemotaxis protein
VTDGTRNGNDLNGLRILVVEDEAAISLLLEDMLLDFGCEVVGPAGRLNTALDLAATEALDLAILDVNVAGEPVYPVAETLEQRKVPFVFSTGYGSAGIKETFRDRPVVQKPFAQSDLRQRLLHALKAERPA